MLLYAVALHKNKKRDGRKRLEVDDYNSVAKRKEKKITKTDYTFALVDESTVRTQAVGTWSNY